MITKNIETADWKPLVTYTPHGINENMFFKIHRDDEENYAKLVLFRKELFGDKKYEFVLFYNSRNIHRKHPSDIMLAFKHFCDNIGPEATKKVVLLMHTQDRDDNGTDLVAVKNALCEGVNIVFSGNRLEPEKMNFLYNIADATILISSAEGFGLSGAEALTSETPIIVNVTGGMQDYCGFTDDEGEPIKFTKEWGSNHDGRYKTHGKWVYPIFPADRSLQGSIPTPYIFDDRVKIEDITKGIYYWYKVGKDNREKAGKLGREFILNNGFNSENMCSSMITSIDTTLTNWKKKKKFNLYKIEKPSLKSGGFVLKELDKSEIDDKINDDWK